MAEGIPPQLKKRYPKDQQYHDFSIGDGWVPIVVELDEHLSKLDPDYEIHQIKEKFGGLRFYAHSTNPGLFEEFNQLISDAESFAETICEFCGSPDIAKQPKSQNWIKTLCKKCWVNRINRQREATKKYKAEQKAREKNEPPELHSH